MAEPHSRKLTDRVTVKYFDGPDGSTAEMRADRADAWATFATDDATRSLDPRDTAAVAQLLAARPPQERRRLAKAVGLTAWWAWYPGSRGFPDKSTIQALTATKQVCGLGALGPTSLSFGVWPLRDPPFVSPEAVRLWLDRGERDRAAWVGFLRRRPFDQAAPWFILRQLEREADARTPHDAEYMRLAWDALDPYGHLRFTVDREDATTRYLANDPTLATEMADALRFPTVADHLASFAKRDILARILRWEREGIMPRALLIDATLDCLAQDNKPGTSAALRRVVSALEPTPSELAGAIPRLLAIVSHAHPAEQAEAAVWLAAAASAGAEFDARHAERALASALEASKAAGAKKLLKAAGTLLSPESRRAVLRVGLVHESDDVATACVSGLAPPESLSDADRAALRAALEDASPRLGLAIGALLEPGGAPAPYRPIRAADPGAAPRVRPGPEPSSLGPLPDAHAVAEHLLAFLAGSASGVEIEQALDGLSRHASTGVSAAERSVLSRAIERNRAPSEWHEIHRDAAILDSLAAWTAGRRPGPARTPRASGGGARPAIGLDGVRLLLTERFREASLIGASAPRASLCLPTSSDGTIRAADGDRRVERGRAPAMPAESAIARLRGAGGDDAVTLIDVQFRATPSPWGPLPPRRTTRANVQKGVRHTPPLAALVAGLDPETDANGRFVTWGFDPWGTPFLEWAVITFPRHLDALAAVTSTSLHLSATEDDRHRGEHAVVRAIGRTPVGLGGNLLLLAALWSRVTSARAVATDVLHALALTGDVPVQRLGSISGALAAADAPGLSRFSEALRDAARDPVTAPAVVELVSEFVVSAPPDHRDMGRVLEAWEIAIASTGSRVTDHRVLEALRLGATGSSKRAHSARRLLGGAS